MAPEYKEAEIDFDHLNQYVDGNKELIAEIFGLFKNQVDMWQRQFETGLDDELWYAMMHSLKGTCRAVGANRLADQCETAEKLVGSNNRPGARDVSLERIQTHIDQTLIEIQRWEYRQSITNLKSGEL